MSENETTPVPQGNATLEKIQLLANLANGVQHAQVKETLLSLPAGARLYDIFVAAVSKEIESMMDKQEPTKEVLDAASVANGLKTTLTHLYGMIAEINRSQVLGVLNLLNQNLGGRSMPPPPDDPSTQQTQQMLMEQQIRQQQRAQAAQQPQQASDATPAVRRSNNTGLSW